MTFLKESLFNFTTSMSLKPSETNTQKDLHGFEYTMSKKSTEMKYFGISETVSVKIPFRTPLLVCSYVH